MMNVVHGGERVTWTTYKPSDFSLRAFLSSSEPRDCSPCIVGLVITIFFYGSLPFMLITIIAET